MTEQIVKTAPLGKRRWGRVVLIVSLALNLIVVGLVAGAFFGGHKQGLQPALGVRNYVAAMTKTQRHEFLRNSDHGMMDHLKVVKILNHGQSGILNAIEAETFDAQVLLQAMKDQRAQLSTVTHGFHKELAKALAGMSQAERKSYVERYKNRGKNRWGRRHDKQQQKN